jgi:hypothetical protein
VSEESSSPRPIFALSDAVGIVTSILKLAEDLNQYKDLDVLLDNLLSAARRLVNADAGAIYLVENERLGFSYVQNDTLFRSTNNKHVYTNASLPIDERSIVGYAALTGAPLAIDDAYELPESYPFHFNRSFDQKTGYTRPRPSACCRSSTPRTKPAPYPSLAARPKPTSRSLPTARPWPSSAVS